MRTCGKAVFALLFFGSALTRAQTFDNLILPTVRVGAITRSTTRAELHRVFSRGAVSDAPIGLHKQTMEPGTVIFKGDPSRTLAILWNSEGHPQTAFICYERKTGPCRWHLPGGIGIGTTLRQIQAQNGKPFLMTS